MRPPLPILAVACLLGAAGCGGSAATDSPRATSAAATGHASQERPCRKQTAATRRARATLARDVRAIKLAAARPTRDRLGGNPSINRAIDRFLLDQGSLPLDNFTRNRFINRAVALSVAVCQQCFQALEAARPITQASLSQPGALPCPGRKR
jgi:hypothetical protein